MHRFLSTGLLLVLLCVVPSLADAPEPPTFRYASEFAQSGDGDPGSCYVDWQDAITQAPLGSTVVLSEGCYEGPVEIGTSKDLDGIKVQGSGRILCEGGSIGDECVKIADVENFSWEGLHVEGDQTAGVSGVKISGSFRVNITDFVVKGFVDKGVIVSGDDPGTFGRTQHEINLHHGWVSTDDRTGAPSGPAPAGSIGIHYEGSNDHTAIDLIVNGFEWGIKVASDDLQHHPDPKQIAFASIHVYPFPAESMRGCFWIKSSQKYLQDIYCDNPGDGTPTSAGILCEGCNNIHLTGTRGFIDNDVAKTPMFMYQSTPQAPKMFKIFIDGFSCPYDLAASIMDEDCFQFIDDSAPPVPDQNAYWSGRQVVIQGVDYANYSGHVFERPGDVIDAIPDEPIIELRDPVFGLTSINAHWINVHRSGFEWSSPTRITNIENGTHGMIVHVQNGKNDGKQPFILDDTVFKLRGGDWYPGAGSTITLVNKFGNTWHEVARSGDWETLSISNTLTLGTGTATDSGIVFDDDDTDPCVLFHESTESLLIDLDGTCDASGETWRWNSLNGRLIAQTDRVTFGDGTDSLFRLDVDTTALTPSDPSFRWNPAGDQFELKNADVLLEGGDLLLDTEDGDETFNIRASDTTLDRIDIDVNADGNVEAQWSTWDFIGMYLPYGVGSEGFGNAAGMPTAGHMAEWPVPVPVVFDTVEVEVFGAFSASALCSFAIYANPDSAGVATKIVGVEDIGDWDTTGRLDYSKAECDANPHCSWSGAAKIWMPPGVVYAAFSCDEPSPGTLMRVIDAGHQSVETRRIAPNFADKTNPPSTFDIGSKTRDLNAGFFFKLLLLESGITKANEVP